jgi:hypothetical protein
MKNADGGGKKSWARCKKHSFSFCSIVQRANELCELCALLLITPEWSSTPAATAVDSNDDNEDGSCRSYWQRFYRSPALSSPSRPSLRRLFRDEAVRRRQLQQQKRRCQLNIRSLRNDRLHRAWIDWNAMLPPLCKGFTSLISTASRSSQEALV